MNAACETELSTLRSEHAKALADLRNEFQGQIDKLNGDLEKAKADLSGAVQRAETAEKDLASKGEQLDRLEKAHALLTGGVLSPGDGNAAETEYQNELKAAGSAEQREAVRKAHYSHRKTAKK